MRVAHSRESDDLYFYNFLTINKNKFGKKKLIETEK